MAIFGFWPKNGAKIGFIEKYLHFSSELHALSGELFVMSKLPFKCIFDNFGPIQGGHYVPMPENRV